MTLAILILRTLTKVHDYMSANIFSVCKYYYLVNQTFSLNYFTKNLVNVI